MAATRSSSTPCDSLDLATPAREDKAAVGVRVGEEGMRRLWEGIHLTVMSHTGSFPSLCRLPTPFFSLDLSKS